jgi:hypothetical protein
VVLGGNNPSLWAIGIRLFFPAKGAESRVWVLENFSHAPLELLN